LQLGLATREFLQSVCPLLFEFSSDAAPLGFGSGLLAGERFALVFQP